MPDFLDALDEALGPDSLLRGQAALERAHSPWCRLGAPAAILRPQDTAALAKALALANAAGRPVTPWGGLTGLVDGAYAEGALAVSLERMDRIEAIDPVNATLTVQAGCKVQTACEAVEQEGLFLPLDLGSRGSATIGGAISTNAGGNRVVRWGMMRDQVLGLEAVLADGTVISAMNSLIKNNAGYDLKHLFIGSEGTLGVVTRAVLRLRPNPTSQCTAFLGVESFDQLTALLAAARRELGGGLNAFEVMWPAFYSLVTTQPAKGRPVLPEGSAYYVLVETLGSEQAADEARLEAFLVSGLEGGLIADAVMAKSGAERAAMWALRDDVAQTARNGPIFAFDVSLPIAEMPDYVETVRARLSERWGEHASLVVFGHLGDGNLHLIVGVGARDAETRHAVETTVYAPLAGGRGSISAEHGVGLQKRDYLQVSRSDAEIGLMRRLKRALDPKAILNPGKVFAPETPPGG